MRCHWSDGELTYGKEVHIGIGGVDETLLRHEVGLWLALEGCECLFCGGA